MRTKNWKYISTIIIIGLLFFTRALFATDIDIGTNLGINDPVATLIFNPPYATGFFTSGNVYANITGDDGIVAPTYVVTGNNTYQFDYRRGTGPYTTGADFSSGNTRTHYYIIDTITRIDKIPPTFIGIATGEYYNTDITISFSDNNSGATATLNGNPYTSGTIITGDGIYVFIVNDVAGYSTGATFTIDKTPPTASIVYDPDSGGGWTSGNVLATLTGENEAITVTNFGGLTGRTFVNNGTFTFEFEDNAGNTGEATATVTRIDNTPPTYSGFTNGSTYTTGITITFDDNNTGVTATLNGSPFASGTAVSGYNTYTLIVTDIAGNTVTASFTISSGGGGGGGGTIPDPEPPIVEPPIELIITPEDEEKYSKEMLDAYKYAHRLGITTKDSISTANLDGPLIRKELAKMISVYATKVVGLEPNHSKICNFSDVEEESEEMKYYMDLSCKLGLMGLRPDGIEVRDTFMPNEYVNRAQFGTVFSRLIFGLEYNLKGNELTVFDKTMNALRGATQQIADFLGIKYVANIQIDRYSKHLEALKQTNIMTKVEPLIIEIRGYVMVMMMRADINGIIQTYVFNKG